VVKPELSGKAAPMGFAPKVFLWSDFVVNLGTLWSSEDSDHKVLRLEKEGRAAIARPS
jgi:hypothetical protein